jgi:hypothetical protein
MNPRIPYVAVWVDDDHIVIAAETISDFRELDNGFMFRVGENWCYTPYFFQHKDLKTAWKFAHNARDAARREAAALCPDKV